MQLEPSALARHGMRKRWQINRKQNDLFWKRAILSAVNVRAVFLFNFIHWHFVWVDNFIKLGGFGSVVGAATRFTICRGVCVCVCFVSVVLCASFFSFGFIYFFPFIFPFISIVLVFYDLTKSVDELNALAFLLAQFCCPNKRVRKKTKKMMVIYIKRLQPIELISFSRSKFFSGWNIDSFFSLYMIWCLWSKVEYQLRYLISKDVSYIRLGIWLDPFKWRLCLCFSASNEHF